MPKTIIKFNKYLDEITKAYCLTLPKYANRAALETDEIAILEKIEEYKTAWRTIEEKVFQAISDKARRSFPYSVVNINIVSIVHRTEAFSMIFPANKSVDKFIISLIHELIHLSWYFETEEYKKLFENESISTRQHIIIHAMLEYIYREILFRPEYVELDKSICENHSTNDYIKAWNIVDELGYKNILNTYVKKFPNLKLHGF